MRRAAESGYEALVLTTDVPVSGKRERDFRNGFKQPIALTLSAKLDVLLHPRWLFTVGLNRPSFVNVEIEMKGRLQKEVFFPSLFDPAVTWADLERVRAAWPRKLLLKGVLSVEDAERAVQLGCDGVAISNHGGRQLDGAAATIDALPAIADAVGDRAELLLDSGVRRGTDIVKALALGARAVLIGRPLVYGLGAAGEAGGRRAFAILEAEL